MSHSITIVIKDDGTVQGDVDDEVAIWSIDGTGYDVRSRAEDVFKRALNTLLGRQHVPAPDS